MAQLVDTAWSPSKSQHIVGTRQQVGQDASEVLFSVVQRELANFPGNDEQKQVIRQRTLELSELIETFVSEANKDRIISLEAELEMVCAEGEEAEAAFLNTKNEELVIRNAEERRITRYNAATRALTNARNEDLGAFHTNGDIVRKLERIAKVQEEIEDTVTAMRANPLSIPQAVQAKMNAEQRLNTLAARARAIRRELAGLKGEDAHTEASGGRSATGLGALR